MPPTRGIIAWNKRQMMPTFSRWEYAWSSFDRPAKMYERRSQEGEGRFHPTQKPVALYKWLLEHYAKAGDKILDTHVGSASSLVACRELGFKYVGFEIDEDYYKLAKKRLESAEAQMNLWDFGFNPYQD